MPVDRELIFDVGVYDGADSAYYLHKGFRVVGIEANPLLIPQLGRRFGEQIATGRYTLLNVAVAAEDGEGSFWVCDDVPPRSSQHRALANYAGARYHEVKVNTRAFGSIIREFGTPFYLKVDIASSDHLCMGGFDQPPPFISLELGAEQMGEQVVERLQKLGYDRFKIISQLSFRQPTALLARAKSILPPRIGNWLTPRSDRTEAEWRFPPEASGPFGEDTSGRWHSSASAAALIRLLLRNERDCDWYDIHASLPDR